VLIVEKEMPLLNGSFFVARENKAGPMRWGRAAGFLLNYLSAETSMNGKS